MPHDGIPHRRRLTSDSPGHSECPRSDIGSDLLDRAQECPERGYADSVQQSDNPTPRALVDQRHSHVPAPGTEPARGHERERDPDARARIAHFYEAIMAGLPKAYLFDPDRRIIRKAFKGHDICGPIRVVSLLCRPDGSGRCAEVEFMDHRGLLQRAVFAHEEIVMGRGGFLSSLIDRGFATCEGIEQLHLVLKHWTDHETGWRTDRAGWFEIPDGPMCYLQSDGTLHVPSRLSCRTSVVLFDPDRAIAPRGTLAGWQKGVAVPARGHHPLVFAISAALAGPLLRFAEIETVMINLVTAPTAGRSIPLSVALSCGGDPADLAPWPVARTGLSSRSVRAQDGLLTLEAFPLNPEPGQVRALMALADDAGFGAVVCGTDPHGGSRYRRVILSTSEEPLTQMMTRLRKKIPAALRARSVDVLDFDRKGIGGGLETGPDVPDVERAITKAMRQHHGHLTHASLARLMEDPDRIAAELDEVLPGLAREMADILPPASSETSVPMRDIARSFALIGFSGELAIRSGLLPWPEGTAYRAARELARRVSYGDGLPTVALSGIHERFFTYLRENRQHLIDLHPGHPAEAPPTIAGWQDKTHIYLNIKPLCSALCDFASLRKRLLDDRILLPGGEERLLQYKMAKSLFADRTCRRVYRLDRARVEDTMRKMRV